MIANTQELDAVLRHLTSVTNMLTTLYLDAKERSDFTLFLIMVEGYFIEVQELNAEVRAQLQSSENVKPGTTLNELVAGITELNRHGEVDFGPAVGNEIW